MTNREQRKAAAKELKAKAAAVPVEVPKFDTPEEANTALASVAKVLNLKEKQMENEKKKAKAAPKVNKDGRTALPPLPKAPAKAKPLRDCRCGCGGQTRSQFVPGHDSRMRGWILRVERGFIKLSEIPDGERQAVAAELKLRAKVDGKSAAAGA